jgi:glutamate N-acetyltransferase/amino-acid N-acetyltransferase
MNIPKGFRVSTLCCGIRSKKMTKNDVAFFLSDVPANFALVTTQNQFVGEPVKWNRKIAASQKSVRGVLINTGQANVATGEQGKKDVEEMAHLSSVQAKISKKEEMFIASTGVIGKRINMEAFRKNFFDLSFSSEEVAFRKAAKTILTTDLVSKVSSTAVDGVSILGVAKGSGMIEPNMATMLAVIMTDADIPNKILQEMLKRVSNRTFNCVSVDTDTSTSDCAFLLANGLSGKVDHIKFERALEKVCTHLSRKIAQDGEGATKLITVHISGAESDLSARIVGKAIVNSPLVKSAMFGNDANWGRIAMSMGKCGEKISPEKGKIAIGKHVVYDGKPKTGNEEKIEEHLRKNSEIIIEVFCGVGKGKAIVWGCDLTYDYVKINAEYHT